MPKPRLPQKFPPSVGKNPLPPSLGVASQCSQTGFLAGHSTFPINQKLAIVTVNQKPLLLQLNGLFILVFGQGINTLKQLLALCLRNNQKNIR